MWASFGHSSPGPAYYHPGSARCKGSQRQSCKPYTIVPAAYLARVQTPINYSIIAFYITVEDSRPPAQATKHTYGFVRADRASTLADRHQLVENGKCASGLARPKQPSGLQPLVPLGLPRYPIAPAIHLALTGLPSCSPTSAALLSELFIPR